MSKAWSARELGFAVQRISRFDSSDFTRWYEWLIRPVDVEADAFIDAIQSLGEGLALDQLVIRRAMAWLAEQPIDIRLSINVFASSISKPEFLDFVVEQISRHDVSPEQVCFEITEHEPISDLAVATRFVRLIRRFGVRIALDDIGAGNMHMGLLIPTKHVDYLKIDRKWVRPALESPSHRQRLETLVAFAKRVEIELVIEGVETEQHRDLVGELEADYYQGYLDGLPERVTPEVMDTGIKIKTTTGDWLQIA